MAQTTTNPNANLSLSEAGIEALMQREGFKPKAYKDGAGVWTIGYGTTKIDGVAVTEGMEITNEQAKDYFQSDVTKFEEAVRSKITKELTQDQFDALTSFTYNTGAGGLNGDVGKYANAGEMSKVPGAMLKYIGISPTVKVGENNIKITVPDDGLASRRIDEAYQFDPSSNTKGDLFDIALGNAEKMREKSADKLAQLSGWRAEEQARVNRLLDEQYFPNQANAEPNMSMVERLPGYRDELADAVRREQSEFEKEWEKLGKKYSKDPDFTSPDLADVESRLRSQGEWPTGNIEPTPPYCPMPDPNAPLFTPANPEVPQSWGDFLPPASPVLTSPLTSISDGGQPILLASNIPLSGFSADGMSYSDYDAAIAQNLLGSAFRDGSGSAQSMTDLEGEGEDKAGEADSHADRAETAARRARRAARSAASSAARLRAMLSRKR